MNIYDIEVVAIDGRQQTLADFRGQSLLIVNVASRCGFTPQYAGLESLYRQYKNRGFSVLGFPCDQFGHQEPGSEAEIQQFCTAKYEVSFPLFAKIEVNGPGTHPLYQFLKGEKSGILGTAAIKWNFTKFLLNRQGEVIQRYAPVTTPDKITVDIEQLLQSNSTHA
ncbi:MAG TPA: glutathione peroxidase [Pirellulales bacterium]|jgi:glutathione peroxidase|nr:glutathione peroxidase [Pirellulales bacterium]